MPSHTVVNKSDTEIDDVFTLYVKQLTDARVIACHFKEEQACRYCVTYTPPPRWLPGSTAAIARAHM